MAVAAPFPEHATPVDPVLVRVLGLARPLCEARGVSVAWVKWAVDHGGRVLRVTIEPTSAVTQGVREGGVDPSVSLDECAWVSRALSEVLDADEDIVPGVYSLEVSSPGIDRELVSWADFRRFLGREVSVKLREPQPDGQRALRGKIISVSAESPPFVEMIADHAPQRFPITSITAAHLVVELPKLKKASEKDSEKPSEKPSKGPKKSSSARHSKKAPIAGSQS